MNVHREIDTCLMVLDSITEDREFYLTNYSHRPEYQAQELSRLDRRFEEWHAILSRLSARVGKP